MLPIGAFHDALVGSESRNWLADVPETVPWHFFVSFPGPHRSMRAIQN
jgi:hypothetical protein